MDLAWTNSLDRLWHSPTFPMLLMFAAAAFFALVFLVIVLRADRSIANGALAAMALLAVAVAATASVQGFGQTEDSGSVHARMPLAGEGSLPALACIDDLAGDSVEAACEKVLFGSPDHVAAAVSYAAGRLSRLTTLGDVAAAGKVMTPDLLMMRRAIERDRYGLMAHVLTVRDGCTAAICTAYRSLTDRKQIATNIEERTYDGLVERYSASWGGAVSSAVTGNPAAAAAAVEPATVPTGRPTNADFPTSASIPPVSIMNPEPSAGTAPAPAATTAPPTPAPRPSAAAKAQPAPHPAPARRRPAPAPKSTPSAPPPVQLAPAPARNER